MNHPFCTLQKSPSTAANPLTALEKVNQTFYTNGDTSVIRAWARTCDRLRKKGS